MGIKMLDAEHFGLSRREKIRFVKIHIYTRKLIDESRLTDVIVMRQLDRLREIFNYF